YGRRIVLDRYGEILSVDRERLRVTVQAGCPIRSLDRQLAELGWALPNLGDIEYQTISGAISTATHGTGVRLGGLATQVVGLELVTGDGSVLRCSPEEEAEVFACARVGLGALGVLSTVTLQCVPAFKLHAVEEPLRLDHVLENLDSYVEENDHFEFYYVPHTGWTLTKRNNRTDAPVGGMPRWKEARDKVLVENIAFGLVCRIGRRRPQLIRRLNHIAPSAGRLDYVKPSHRTFVTPRLVHFVEMEYSIPRQAVPDALLAVRAFIDRSGMMISFPIEVRFVAPDDIPLSTAFGEHRGYIAVHRYVGEPFEQYFRGVEAIMDPLGGRPHWGKMHYQTAATLAPRYPEWDRFAAVRRRTDPDGRFRNAYLDRVLGLP
ncbi:MAG: FAD-binding protein, partial [Acidimicrobiia bacterium]|nr:FAD-binding protein [Acidimicrobiia bacterium]